MDRPAIPINEAERLRALRNLLILDTPPERRFDNLTSYASLQFRVPIAMISLVDDARIWVKSVTGIELSEVSRGIGLCAHTILTDGVLAVDDASKDPRFAGNPVVTGGPMVRFYAGAPIIVSGGHAIGSFSVVDRRPRRLDTWEADHLAELAKVAALEIEGVSASDEFMKKARLQRIGT